MKQKPKYDLNKTYIITLKPEFKGVDVQGFLDLIHEHKPIKLPEITIHWVEEKYEPKQTTAKSL